MATSFSGSSPNYSPRDELKMSLGTGLNIVQCRTRKTTKAGQGHSPPHRKFGKNNARRCLFFGGGGGKASEAFGITHFYEVTKNNDQYSNDLVI